MLPIGKLPVDFLKICIAHTGNEDPRVLIGPRFGEDCAVVDIGHQYLVVKTDPVTFTAGKLGWYAVHINANDIATMGARPQWFQSCLLFPPGTGAETIRQVFQQIDETSRTLGVTVTGGHTEWHQGFRLDAGDCTLVYPGELVPTRNHIRPYWNMAYDMFPHQTITAKQAFLAEAAAAGWIVAWDHDTVTPWSQIAREDSGFVAVDVEAK